ncbi:glycoside hydrolase family 3 protein [Coprobacter fastidiosus]|jgi:beta-glucosidase|uniref:glycoside hydrolase family 3 protein n=1 Tax=Coprobacter fastidiosus TaxID=1099853 RepID=UPI00241FDF0C|nr:glycoside hydrolase family 3 protein [Coprobacter fastidiosus]
MKHKTKSLFVVLALVFSGTLFAQKEVYKDMDAPQHERIMDLLSRLTIEEKISLLRATSPGIPRLEIEKYYHGNEALHGIVRPGNFTVFPQAIGLASMWNPDFLYEISTVISDEARARWNELNRGKDQKRLFSDLLTFWSPTVNMARDPRWGRTPETYGEDPFLSGKLGVAFVKGLQGNDPHYLKVVSTPKHFAANNEEHNRFECNPQISERDLREYYLPAFERCIIDGKAQSIMTAYNAINDVPCTLNTWLLKKVLRTDWGFNGYVVSDCGAPSLLVTHHEYVKTPEAAATLALKAGLDLECGDNVYIEPLMNAYKQYMVSEAEIDTAAYRILRARMMLGLFDDPAKNPYNALSPSIVGCEKHKNMALEAARQSLVLLKNENNFLPINPKKIKSIAVVGINAGNCEFGDYSGKPVNVPVSVLDGIRNRVGDDIKIVYAPWKSSSSGYEMITKANFPNGLKAEYYNNKHLQGTPQVRTDENINFEPANQAPDPFLPESPLSIRWSGDLVPSVSGKYTLAFATDDGCRLYIDDKMVIDSWKNRGLTTDSVVVTLEKDKKYRLVAEYFDNAGEASAKLYWRTPDFEKKALLDLYGDAKKAIQECDMTIAVMGINKSIEREGRDRDHIELPKDQELFIEEAYKLNPKMAVVLVAGSSLAVNWMDEHVPAILNAWYPGEQGGTAVAEALFGDYNPAGRLPLTYYRSLDDLPPFDDYAVQKNRTYMYFTGKPLYAFGYGLSYTKFDYRKLSVDQDAENVRLSFTIKNSGKYNGDEVAQVYVQFPEIGVKVPIKQLKGFERVHIAKGKNLPVTITVPKKELRIWNERKGEFFTPSGNYVFMVGASSDDIRLQQVVKL